MVSSTGLPPTGSMGLGVLSVSGRRRVPKPPAMSTTQFSREGVVITSARVFKPTKCPASSTTGRCRKLRPVMSAARCALLSEGLAVAVPRLMIAVTGSVNQNGDIQAIGGVNSKIEGFYDICCVRKLNGKQGVIIPKSNLHNLMLREDVVEAVRQEQFHIWAVSSIEEGIEILTGRPAGVRDKRGLYPVKSVYGLAEKRLDEFAEHLKGSKSKIRKPGIKTRSPKNLSRKRKK